MTQTPLHEIGDLKTLIAAPLTMAVRSRFHTERTPRDEATTMPLYEAWDLQPNNTVLAVLDEAVGVQLRQRIPYLHGQHPDTGVWHNHTI
jgi:hypothetical protein